MSDKEVLSMIVDSLAKQDAINAEQTKTLDKIGKCLVRQEESLKYHIKRTDLLEESVEILRNSFEPVDDHVKFVNLSAKIFAFTTGTVIGIAAIIFGVVRWLF